MQYAIHDGKQEVEKKCLIHVNNPEFYSGYSVYETFRVKNSKVLNVKPHLQRLFRSAELLNIHCPFSEADFIEALTDIVDANNLTEAGLRLLLIGGETPHYYVFSFPPLIYQQEYYTEGVKVVSYKGERSFPEAKTHCLLINYMARQYATENDAFEALLLNREGILVEGSRTNLFAIRKNTLMTKERDVLAGVTRQRIIDQASDVGLKFQYENITLDGVKNGDYDMLFISSTSMGAIPVKQIDEKVLSIDAELIKKINYYLQEESFSEQNM